MAGFRSVLFLLGLSSGPLPPETPIYRQPRRVGTVVQFLVADVNGRVLTRLQPHLERIAWRKNGAGAMAFTLARSDPKLREEYFVDGNRIMLRFDNGLRDWGGVLAGARDWSGDGVTFEAYSAEWLLSQRRTARSRSFEAVPVGTILSTLIQEANSFYPSGLRAGSLWSSGAPFSPTFLSAPLYEVVAGRLIGDYDAGAFDVTPSLEDGFIQFYVNLYARKGSDKPGVALVEGRNVSSIRYREPGGIVNHWVIAGDGAGWSAESRPFATASNADSVQKHGMREDGETRSGISEQAALDMAARERVNETAWPTRVLGLKVTNDAPGRFEDYWLGDVVTCRLPSFGFGGVHSTFEVLGVEFFPADGTVDLVLAERRL